MADPFMTTIAAVLSGHVKIGSKAARKELERHVRKQASVIAALDEAQESTDDTVLTELLAGKLLQAVEADSEWAEVLYLRWTRLVLGEQEPRGGNSFEGTATGTVFQIGGHAGDLHLNR
jgi:hypothetical protein